MILCTQLFELLEFCDYTFKFDYLHLILSSVPSCRKGLSIFRNIIIYKINTIHNANMVKTFFKADFFLYIFIARVFFQLQISNDIKLIFILIKNKNVMLIFEKHFEKQCFLTTLPITEKYFQLKNNEAI